MNTAIPWYKSSIVVGIVVSMVCKVLVLSGLTQGIAADEELRLTNALVGILGAAGDIWALTARLRHPAAAPIVLTKGAAEAHSAGDTMLQVQAELPPLIADGPWLGQAEASEEEQARA